MQLRQAVGCNLCYTVQNCTGGDCHVVGHSLCRRNFRSSLATGLKYSEGFTRFWPAIFTLVTLVLSFVLLSVAMKDLPVSIAYPIWTGIGALGTVITGAVLLNEPFDIYRLACVTMIVTGITGLRLLN